MLDMDMGQQSYSLSETGPGRYPRYGMPLIMVDVRGDPEAGHPVLVPRRRPRERMSRRRDPRLLVGAALLALVAAFVAVLIVVLLARSVLGG